MQCGGFKGLAPKVTVTISVTFSLGVNYLFTFIHERTEEIMFLLSALVAYVWIGVAFLWRPGGSLPHARGGIEGEAITRSKRNVREVRFLPSTPSWTVTTFNARQRRRPLAGLALRKAAH